MRAFIVAAATAALLAVAAPLAAQPAPAGGVQPAPAGDAPAAPVDGDPADEDPLTDVLEEGAAEQPADDGGGGWLGWARNPLAALGEWVGRGAAWMMGKVIGFVDEVTAPDVEALWLNRLYAEMVAASMWLAAFFVVGAVIQSVLAGGVAALGAVIVRVFVVAVALGIALRFVGLVLDATDALSSAMLATASDGLGQLSTTVSTALISASAGTGAPLIVITILAAVILLAGMWVWLLMIFRTAAIYILLVLLAWPAAMAVGGNRSSIRRYRSWLLGMIFLKPVVAAMLLIGSAPFAESTGGVADAGVTAAAIGAGVLASAGIAPWFLARFFDSSVVAPAAAMFQSIMPRSVGSRGPVGATRQVGRLRERFLSRSQATRSASTTTARATTAASAATAPTAALAAGSAATKLLTRPVRRLGDAADRAADSDRVMVAGAPGDVRVSRVGTRLPITTAAEHAERAGFIPPRVHDEPIDVEVVAAPRSSVPPPAAVESGVSTVGRVGDPPALPVGRSDVRAPTGRATPPPRSAGMPPAAAPTPPPRAAVDPPAAPPPVSPPPPPRRDAPPVEQDRISAARHTRTPGRGRVVSDGRRQQQPPTERPDPPEPPRRDPRRVEPPADRPRRNDR